MHPRPHKRDSILICQVTKNTVYSSVTPQHYFSSSLLWILGFIGWYFVEDKDSRKPWKGKEVVSCTISDELI